MPNLIKTLSLVFFISVGFLSAPSLAAESVFKKNNPDGYKYEFARSYISALKYFYEINQRWSKNSPKKNFAGDDVKTIRATIEYLVRDNSDLRVAKNYMVKYLTSPNALMRKVADMMIVSCDNGVMLNNKAKNLWQDWLNLKVSGRANPEQERLFIRAQQDIELKRKEFDKSLIQASILMTKVLLSQENANDKGRVLAITDKQRSRLLDGLDVYGKDVINWGLKSGQSTLQASIAVIREVLEDPVFVTHK
jgi:hypothetical protein